MGSSLLRALRTIERFGVVTLFGIMLVLFFANVLVRVVAPSYASNIAWAEEAARLAMIWGLFLVAGMTLERGRHIAMTSALMLLPLPLQLAVRRLIGVVGAVFCGYFTYLALRMTLFVFGTGQVIPSLNLSSAYLYMGAAIGLALLSLRYVIEVADPRAPLEFQEEA